MDMGPSCGRVTALTRPPTTPRSFEVTNGGCCMTGLAGGRPALKAINAGSCGAGSGGGSSFWVLRFFFVKGNKKIIKIIWTVCWETDWNSQFLWSLLNCRNIFLRFVLHLFFREIDTRVFFQNSNSKASSKKNFKHNRTSAFNRCVKRSREMKNMENQIISSEGLEKFGKSFKILILGRTTSHGGFRKTVKLKKLYA